MSQIPLNGFIGSGSSPATGAYGSNLGAGSIAPVGLRFNATPSSITVVGSRNGAYTQRGTVLNVIGDVHVAFFDCPNVAAGSETITVTWTGGGSVRILACEVPGSSSTPFDQTSQNASGSTGTAMTTGTTPTRTQATEVALDFFASEGVNTYTAAGGSTAVTGTTGDNTTFMQYQQYTVTGTDAGLATLGSADNWGGIRVTYMAAGGGGGQVASQINARLKGSPLINRRLGV